MLTSGSKFDLYIQHGRKFPNEDLDDWGPNGPKLKNCIGVHSTYKNMYAYFATPRDREIAERQTGWEQWDQKSLIMKYCDDLLVAKFEDGSVGYFGDWGLIAPVETENVIFD